MYQVHTSLYLLVMRFMILKKSTFQFGTEYIQLGCADLDVLSTKSKCLFLQDREQHYKAAQGGMYRYIPVQVVSYDT